MLDKKLFLSNVEHDLHKMLDQIAVVDNLCEALDQAIIDVSGDHGHDSEW